MKFLKQFADIIFMGFICYKLGVFAHVTVYSSAKIQELNILSYFDVENIPNSQFNIAKNCQLKQ